MFNVEAEELFQEGMLAVAETYSHYGYNHSDGRTSKPLPHDNKHKDIQICSKRVQAENPKYFGEKT